MIDIHASTIITLWDCQSCYCHRAHRVVTSSRPRTALLQLFHATFAEMVEKTGCLAQNRASMGFCVPSVSFNIGTSCANCRNGTTYCSWFAGGPALAARRGGAALRFDHSVEKLHRKSSSRSSMALASPPSTSASPPAIAISWRCCSSRPFRMRSMVRSGDRVRRRSFLISSAVNCGNTSQIC